MLLKEAAKNRLCWHRDVVPWDFCANRVSCFGHSTRESLCVGSWVRPSQLLKFVFLCADWCMKKNLTSVIASHAARLLTSIFCAKWTGRTAKYGAGWTGAINSGARFSLKVVHSQWAPPCEVCSLSKSRYSEGCQEEASPIYVDRICVYLHRSLFFIGLEISSNPKWILVGRIRPSTPGDNRTTTDRLSWADGSADVPKRVLPVINSGWAVTISVESFQSGCCLALAIHCMTFVVCYGTQHSHDSKAKRTWRNSNTGSLCILVHWSLMCVVVLGKNCWSCWWKQLLSRSVEVDYGDQFHRPSWRL